MSTVTLGRKANHRQELGFVPGFLNRISERVGDYVSRSRAERQLEQLDDRLLADIGMKRADINKMVWGR